MSMHLAAPGLTTTSYKKRKEKITKTKQAELEQGWRDRNQRLKSMGLPKETLVQYTEWVYGLGKKTTAKKEDRTCNTTAITGKSKTLVNTNDQGIKGSGSSSDDKTATERAARPWITGPCSSKPAPIYTGTKVKGIATMHKSNAVPVFNDEEAIDIARMRR